MTALGYYLLSLVLSAFPPGRHPEVETREEAALRLEVAAQALADAAIHADAGWPEGARDLGRAAVSAFGWSMGFRLDVHSGALRGPAGAVCLADLEPATLRRFARFKTDGLSDAELAAKVVGLDYASTRRCFDAGLAALVHARRVASRRCKRTAPELAAFAIYANGNHCSSRRDRAWIERVRYGTLLKFRARKTTILPEWYSATRRRVAVREAS